MGEVLVDAGAGSRPSRHSSILSPEFAVQVELWEFPKPGACPPGCRPKKGAAIRVNRYLGSCSYQFIHAFMTSDQEIFIA
jgi:hypothetical protein